MDLEGGSGWWETFGGGCIRRSTRKTVGNKSVRTCEEPETSAGSSARRGGSVVGEEEEGRSKNEVEMGENWNAGCEQQQQQQQKKIKMYVPQVGAQGTIVVCSLACYLWPKREVIFTACSFFPFQFGHVQSLTPTLYSQGHLPRSIPTRAHTHTYTHTHIRTHTHTHTFAHVGTRKHAQVHTNAPTDKQTCIRTHAHNHLHTYTHSHIPTYRYPCPLEETPSPLLMYPLCVCPLLSHP